MTDKLPQDAVAPEKKSWWGTIKGWHRDDDKLWREIYARTFATLLAAFIAYLIAIVAVGANPAPLRLVLLLGSVGVFLIAPWLFVSTFSWPERPVAEDTPPDHPKRRIFGPIILYVTAGSISLVLFALYQGHGPLEYLNADNLLRIGLAGFVYFTVMVIIDALVRRRRLKRKLAAIDRRYAQATKSDAGNLAV